MTMKQDFLAGWLYASQAQLRDWSLPAAPGWRFPPHAGEVLRILGPGFAEIQASVVQTADPHVWEAPGPWHAALYCHMLQHHASAAGSRFLFRGHRSSSWKLEPSILRRGVDRDHEEQRAHSFCELLASVSFNTMRLLSPAFDLYLRMSPGAYAAAAQHYGIRTSLLDFTTDPDVAVWFATSDGDSDDGMAAIHILPIEVAENRGLSLLLPPPFVNRLYLQRGFFVKADEALDPEGIITIRFPWRPSDGGDRLSGFQVLRAGATPVDLLPAHPGLDLVVKLADRTITEPADAAGRDELDSLRRGLKPALSEVVRDPLQTWYEYLDAFEDALYASVYSINFDNQLALDRTRLSTLVRSNVETCCSVASLYRALPKLDPEYAASTPAGKLAFQAQLADLIDEIALEHTGYVHSREAQRYAEHLGLPSPRPASSGDHG